MIFADQKQSVVNENCRLTIFDPAEKTLDTGMPAECDWNHFFERDDIFFSAEGSFSLRKSIVSEVNLHFFTRLATWSKFYAQKYFKISLNGPDLFTDKIFSEGALKQTANTRVVLRKILGKVSQIFG